MDFLQKFVNKYGETIKLVYISKDCNNDNEFCIFTTEENVYVSGANNHGQLGLAHQNKVENFENIAELKGENLKEIFEGSECMFVITNDGSVFGWGGNNWGQLGRGTECIWGECFKPEIIDSFIGKNITDISCGKTHNLARSSSGLVYGWGDNYLGQIGCGIDKSTISTPVQLSFQSEGEIFIKYVYSYNNSSFAITDDEQVYFWGNNVWFKDIFNLDKIMSPIKIEVLEAAKIVCNKNGIYYISHDHLFQYGSLMKKNIKVADDVSDVLIYREEVLIQKKSGEILVLKSSARTNLTDSKSFSEYFVREMKVTNYLVKYQDVKNWSQTSSLLSRNISSLSVPITRKSLSCSVEPKGKGSVKLISNYYFVKDDKNVETQMTEQANLDNSMLQMELNDSINENYTEIISEIQKLIDKTHEDKFKAFLAKIDLSDEDNKISLTNIIGSKRIIEDIFKDKYDTNLFFFIAINFAFKMLALNKDQNKINLFEAYFEFVLSHFKLKYFENRLIILDQYQNELKNYRETRTLPKKVQKQLQEYYFHFEAIVEQNEIFSDDDKFDSSDEETDDEYDDEEENLIKFESKTVAVCQWFRQSINDLYENKFQKVRSGLISPADYLDQANKVLNSGKIVRTTDDKIYYSDFYRGDESYSGHFRHVIQRKTSKKLLYYWKTNV